MLVLMTALYPTPAVTADDEICGIAYEVLTDPNVDDVAEEIEERTGQSIDEVMSNCTHAMPGDCEDAASCCLLFAVNFVCAEVEASWTIDPSQCSELPVFGSPEAAGIVCIRFSGAGEGSSDAVDGRVTLTGSAGLHDECTIPVGGGACGVNDDLGHYAGYAGSDPLCATISVTTATLIGSVTAVDYVECW